MKRSVNVHRLNRHFIWLIRWRSVGSVSLLLICFLITGCSQTDSEKLFQQAEQKAEATKQDSEQQKDEWQQKKAKLDELQKLGRAMTKNADKKSAWIELFKEINMAVAGTGFTVEEMESTAFPTLSECLKSYPEEDRTRYENEAKKISGGGRQITLTLKWVTLDNDGEESKGEDNPEQALKKVLEGLGKSKLLKFPSIQTSTENGATMLCVIPNKAG